MKTTIDQAMTKVFQQRDPGVPPREPSVANPDTQMHQTVDDPKDRVPIGPVRQVELYVDPPQADLRPACPEVLIPPTAPETADRQQTLPVSDPTELPTEYCESVMTCCDGIPQWSNPFVYQLSVQAPPTETVAPASADAVDPPVEPDAADAPAEPTESHDPAPEEPVQPAEIPPQSRVEDSSPAPEQTAKSEPDPSAAAASFRPVWEVDCLGLPPVCRRIVDTVAADLQRVCQHLSPASGGLRNLVSIDSCTRGEGRTTVALALAHGLAQLGQKVLLVDADFGHPSLAGQLGLAIRQGWEHSVLEDLPIQECCIHSIGDGFTVLPLGNAVLEANDLGTLQRIQHILEELVEHFDRVLLDNGPGGLTWVALPPQRMLAHVVVRSLRQTSASELQRMLDRIQQPDDVLISRVDNFAKPSDLAMAKSA